MIRAKLIVHDTRYEAAIVTQFNSPATLLKYLRDQAINAWCFKDIEEIAITFKDVPVQPSQHVDDAHVYVLAQATIPSIPDYPQSEDITRKIHSQGASDLLQTSQDDDSEAPICVCGHDIEEHTVERGGTPGRCLTQGCPCKAYRAS